MKNTNKFLSLALILSAATSHVDFCMNQEVIKIEELPKASSLNLELNPEFMSNEDRIKELEEEDQKNKRSNIIKERDASLGELSILPNEILLIISKFSNTRDLRNIKASSEIKNEVIGTTLRDRTLGQLSHLPNEILGNICEFTDLKDLRNISHGSQILNELVNTYLETPMRSKRIITVNIDLNDIDFLTKSSKNLNEVKEKMAKFIKGTDRFLVLRFKVPFGLKERVPVDKRKRALFPYLNMFAQVTNDIAQQHALALVPTEDRYTNTVLDKNSFYTLEEDNFLDLIGVSRKDIALSKIKKNKEAISSVFSVFTAGVVIPLTSLYFTIKNIEKTIDKTTSKKPKIFAEKAMLWILGEDKYKETKTLGVYMPILSLFASIPKNVSNLKNNTSSLIDALD